MRNRESVQLFAEKEGAIVGSCSLNRRTGKMAHIALFGIAVSKEFRRKGIGEALARRTIDLARRRMKGLEVVELGFLDYNKQARALYKKLGFVRVAEVPKAAKEGGEYRAQILMHLYL